MGTFDRKQYLKDVSIDGGEKIMFSDSESKAFSFRNKIFKK